jgi:hypothetical protein
MGGGRGEMHVGNLQIDPLVFKTFSFCLSEVLVFVGCHHMPKACF